MKFGRYIIMSEPSKFDLEIELIRENEKLIAYLAMINELYNKAHDVEAKIKKISDKIKHIYPDHIKNIDPDYVKE